MALSTAHGSFQVGPNLDLDSDTVGNTITISGLSFQPKALILWCNGLQSATDTASEGTNLRHVIGFGTSTTNRRSCGAYSQDAAGSMTTGGNYSTTQILNIPNSVGGGSVAIDIDAINSDGFRLIIDVANASTSATVFWIAIGGSDVTNAVCGDVSEPAATGNQNVTSPGFQPTIVFFAACADTSNSSTSVIISDAELMFGAATGTGAGNQFVFVSNQDEGSASSDADRYARGDECLARIVTAGGNPDARAQFNGFTANGFDLNWVTRAITGRLSAYLAIAAGSNVKVGTLSVSLGVTNNTSSVSGLSFTPEQLMLVTHGTSEQAAGTSTTEGGLSVGSARSASDRRCQSFRDENGTGTAEINLGLSYDEVLQMLTTAGAVDAEADISSIDADGFTLICDDPTVNAINNIFAGYIAFGNPAATRPPAPVKINEAVPRSYYW